MAIGNIAMKPGTIVDPQYTVHAAYDAANDAANNRSHGTSIVLTDASAMSRAVRYALERVLRPTSRMPCADEYEMCRIMFISDWG